MSFTLNLLADHQPIAESSLSWFSNLMTCLVTLTTPGEPRSCGSTWPGGTWQAGSRCGVTISPPHPKQCLCLGPSVCGGRGELRTLRLRVLRVPSAKHSLASGPQLPSPCSERHTHSSAASPFSIPGPRSLAGSRQFSHSVSVCCSGHPGPGVGGEARTPHKHRDSNLLSYPVHAKALLLPFHISVCHQNKAEGRLAGREKGAEAKVKRYAHGKERPAAF